MATRKFKCKRRHGQDEPVEIESRSAEYAAEHFAEQHCDLPPDKEMEVVVIDDDGKERCFDVTLEYDVHAMSNGDFDPDE